MVGESEEIEKRNGEWRKHSSVVVIYLKDREEKAV